MLEWECCIQDSESGAKEGADYIRRQIIPVAQRAFDDFARSTTSREAINAMLGLPGGHHHD